MIVGGKTFAINAEGRVHSFDRVVNEAQLMESIFEGNYSMERITGGLGHSQVRQMTKTQVLWHICGQAQLLGHYFTAVKDHFFELVDQAESILKEAKFKYRTTDESSSSSSPMLWHWSRKNQVEHYVGFCPYVHVERFRILYSILSHDQFSAMSATTEKSRILLKNLLQERAKICAEDESAFPTPEDVRAFILSEGSDLGSKLLSWSRDAAKRLQEV